MIGSKKPSRARRLFPVEMDNGGWQGTSSLERDGGSVFSPAKEDLRCGEVNRGHPQLRKGAPRMGTHLPAT